VVIAQAEIWWADLPAPTGLAQASSGLRPRNQEWSRNTDRALPGRELDREVDSYTVLIGPAYCDTRESMVSSVRPSTVACATKILSKGSLCSNGKLSVATT
jgi:hypothetical protein